MHKAWKRNCLALNAVASLAFAILFHDSAAFLEAGIIAYSIFMVAFVEHCK